MTSQLLFRTVSSKEESKAIFPIQISMHYGGYVLILSSNSLQPATQKCIPFRWQATRNCQLILKLSFHDSVLKFLRFRMISSRFHYPIFIHFHFLCSDISVAFGANSVVVAVAFLTDSSFGVSIENEASSNVFVFKSLNFQQDFQTYPFLIVLSRNARAKWRYSSLLHTQSEYEKRDLQTVASEE